VAGQRIHVTALSDLDLDAFIVWNVRAKQSIINERPPCICEHIRLFINCAMALVLEHDPPDIASSVGSASPELDPSQTAGCVPPNLTPLAQRYRPSKEKQFRNTGKSAITPISPPDPAVVLPPRERRRAQNHETIQSGLLQNFMTWELVDSGCWFQDDAKLSSLSDNYPISPVFYQRNWLSGNIQVGHTPGLWEAGNPYIWDILSPSLRLASLLLECSHMSPW